MKTLSRNSWLHLSWDLLSQEEREEGERYILKNNCIPGLATFRSFSNDFRVTKASSCWEGIVLALHNSGPWCSSCGPVIDLYASTKTCLRCLHFMSLPFRPQFGHNTWMWRPLGELNNMPCLSCCTELEWIARSLWLPPATVSTFNRTYLHLS